MADQKPAKKTEAPPATPPTQPTTATGDRNRAPHERFWEAGQALYQSLQQGQEEAQNRFAAAVRDQQQRLWKVQLDAGRRSDELLNDYWSTVGRATGATDFQRINQEATRRYQDGLWDVQTGLRKEWDGLSQEYQRALQDLQDALQGVRVTAFNAYKNACRRAWSEIDANALTCESLATIGQSLSAGAAAVGGCTTCF